MRQQSLTRIQWFLKLKKKKKPNIRKIGFKDLYLRGKKLLKPKMIELFFFPSRERFNLYQRGNKPFLCSLPLTKLGKAGFKTITTTKKDWNSKASASSWEELKPPFQGRWSVNVTMKNKGWLWAWNRWLRLLKPLHLGKVELDSKLRMTQWLCIIKGRTQKRRPPKQSWKWTWETLGVKQYVGKL